MAKKNIPAPAKGDPAAGSAGTPPAGGNPAGTNNPPAQPKEGAGDTKTKKVPALRVASKREGFRRAGRAWYTMPVEVFLSDLTEDQLAQIRAEPMLDVTDIEVEVE